MTLLNHEEPPGAAGLGFAGRGLGRDREVPFGPIGPDRGVTQGGFRHARETSGSGANFRRDLVIYRLCRKLLRDARLWAGGDDSAEVRDLRRL